MIDFRYHLVSIISIFLALAVGIVLGAGPLQDDLGSTLNRQLSDLRSEKESLRADLDDAVVARGAAEAYANEVAAEVLDGRLSGHSVVVIALDGAPEALTDDVVQHLSLTGAALTGIVRLSSAWTDPARASDGPTLPGSSASGLPGSRTGWDAVAGELLASAFVTSTATPGSGSAGQPPDPLASATEAQSRLAQAGLIETSVSPMGAADIVVLLGGPVESTPAAGPGEVGIGSVAGILRDRSLAVVAASPARGRAAEGDTQARDLVAAVREDAAVARVVSTVDHADSATGSSVVILALVEQLDGRVGHYGYGAAAAAPVPDVG